MDSQINALAQLGGTVFTVVAFLYYLDRSENKQNESRDKLNDTLRDLSDSIYQVLNKK